MNTIDTKRPTLRLDWEVASKDGSGKRALVPTTAKSKPTGPEQRRPENTIAVGDKLRLVLQSDMDGYLHFFDFGTSGKVEKLFPCAALSTVNNHIEADKTYKAPGNLLPIPEFSVSGPTTAESGRKERLLVVVTRHPVDLPVEGVVRAGEVLAAQRGFAVAEEAIRALTDLPEDEWTWGLLETEVLNG